MTPKVVMTPTAFIDMILAVKICPVEISGLGKVLIDKKNDRYIIEEISIFEQECSKGGTEFNHLIINCFYEELIAQGRGPEIDFWRFWWHSHVYGLVIWSRTDEETISSWDVAQAEYWISVVLNKLGDSSLRIDYFNPRKSTEHFLYSRIKLSEPIDSADLFKLEEEHSKYIFELIKERVRFV